MDVADIAARLRAVFENPPRAAISDVIALITVSVREQIGGSPSPSITESFVALEKELLNIYEHSVDHNLAAHLEAFLSVLFTLKQVLPASSVISWFDHLRPALRQPSLLPETKRNLQSLLACALDESTHAAESRSRDFRRRLLQLHIVDAPASGASAEDIVEEVNQHSSEKLMHSTWRENLESILELDLTTSPDESFALLNVLFADPTARYPIMALVLRVFVSKHTLPPIVSLSHTLFLDSMMTSILVDKSATLFEREMIALLIIMPYMAIYAPSRLRELLPALLATLARAICWQEKPHGIFADHENQSESQAEEFIGKHLLAPLFVENEDPGPYAQNIVAELTNPFPEPDWIVKDALACDAQSSIDASIFFTFIYGLFPCNTIAFLRRPTLRLRELGFANSLAMSQKYLIDESQIRTISKSLVRSHSFHPDILSRDAQSELSAPHPWSNPSAPNPNASMEDVARLVSTCVCLDHSYRGVKDPEELVRAALERDHLPYRRPGSSANLPARTLLESLGNGHASAYTTSVHAPERGRGDSDFEGFDSTPRVRIRERLHPHLPLFGTHGHGTYDSTDGSGSQQNQHRTFESSDERSSPNCIQEPSLLFSNTGSTSPLSLTGTSPRPGRSPRSSRQSSLERSTAAAFSALVQPPARHSPLTQPSPLSLSSVPLPEACPEDSPQVAVPPNNDTKRAPLLAEGTGGKNSSSSANTESSTESPLSTPPPKPSFTPPNALEPPEPPSETPALDSTSRFGGGSFTDFGVGHTASESSNEQQQRALEMLHHENARLQDLNLLITWMREETKRHAERLYRDRIIMHGEEMELQNLHNRLRDYKRRLSAVQAENETLKRENEANKKRSKEWVDTLQDKLREFRKEKASWTNEAVALRGQVKDAQALMAAREELLHDTRVAHDQLKTEMDYLKPKIEQLGETEKNLERLRKNVTLDESDEVQRLRADSKALHDTQEAMEKQRTIIASLENANEALQQIVSETSSELRRLESNMAAKASARTANAKGPKQRFRPLSQSFSAHLGPPAPPTTPDERCEKLEAQNAELREDVESLTMMVERLRGDAERSRIRQSHNEMRRKSVSLLQSPFAASKSSPSPATLSAVDLSGDAENNRD